MTAIAVIFWTSAFLLVYLYLLYPLVLRLIGCFVRNQVHKEDAIRTVSLIIAAYNEEKSIEAKIQNTLMLNYPEDKLEVIVASDGSTDRTDEIVKNYSDQGIRLLRVEGRRGKTAAQNEAVRVASGEILIFSDATTLYESDVVLRIIRPFADPKVGCAGGRLLFRQMTETAFGGEMNTYGTYEHSVKAMETDIWSICGVDGCLYAVAREHYVEIEDFLTSDFVVPLKMLERRLRVVFEPEAVCYEAPSKNPSGEFNRKIRTTRAGITGMYYMRHLLNPFRYPWAAFCLFNHKVLRWMGPMFMILICLSNLVLLSRSYFYTLSMAAICCFAILSAIGYINERFRIKMRIATIPFNFALINLATIIGFIGFLKGNIGEIWETNRN